MPNEGYGSVDNLRTVNHNFVYADQIAMSFVNHDRNAFTLHLTLVGQTDEQASEREKFDFLFGFMYQGTW